MNDLLVAALHRHGLDTADAPVFVQSFETANLRDLAGRVPVPLVQLLAAHGSPVDTDMPYADLATPAGLAQVATYASAIGPDKRMVVEVTDDGRMGAVTSLVRDAHAAGLGVHAYTFRGENAFLPTDCRSLAGPNALGHARRELVAHYAAGVDAVFADDPAAAVGARTAFERLAVA